MDKNILNYLAARMSEKSTYIGLFTLAIALGINLSPSMSDALAAFGCAIGGLLMVFLRENGSPK